ncbi:MAG: cell division protein ZapA [Salinivirgaceae bacterium]|jgi:cell division protein ZapA (FtsZ GTPase activity inhibitor)|nr:cell division protein ZapA [Salinivirgaceae bacterium]
MDDKLTIRVNIVDRFYPLKIDRKDEEKIRKAAKRINDTVTQYQKLYENKDGQDFLAMVALQFVTRLVEAEEHHEIHPVLEEVRQFDKILAEILEIE